MMRNSFFTAIMLLTGCVTISAQELVQQKEQAFRVKYPDGVVEQYKVRWVATRSIEVHEDGHPAEPFNGWFTDTRQCHWTTNGEVNRHVFLVSKAGQDFEDNRRYTVYHGSSQGKGSDFVLTSFQPENCNSAAARRDSDYNNVKTALLAAFESLSKADFAALIGDYKRNGQTVVVDGQAIPTTTPKRSELPRR